MQRHCIVIAWTVVDTHPQPVTEFRGMVFLYAGSDADIKNAKRYAAEVNPSADVLLFEANHPDPLEAAEAELRKQGHL